MPLRYCLLGSGSKGNAIYIGCGSDAVLLDCGLSARQVMLRMEASNLDPYAIRAIVISHEHRDHIAGARVLAKRLKVPVMATGATWAAALAKEPALCQARHETIAQGREFSLGGITLLGFGISHDAADTMGFVVQNGSARLGVATDLGVPTRLVVDRLQGCQALILEANHDPCLLAGGKYPVWLQQRIRSRQGHLSNPQCAELLEKVHHPGLEQLTLAHLSEENNRPELALDCLEEALCRLDCRAELGVARQERPNGVFDI